MIPLRRHLLLKALELFDLLVALAAFVVAARATGVPRTPHGALGELLAAPVSISHVALFLSFLISWHLIHSFFNLYHSRRLSSTRGEFLDLTRAVSLGSLLLALGGGFLLGIAAITPEFVLYFWAAAMALTFASRAALRGGLREVRLHGRNLRHVLIVGTNPRALHFADRIAARPDLGYRLIGFADDDWPGSEPFRRGGHELVASLDGVPSLLRERVVDEVVIGLPMQSYYSRAAQIVEACEEQGIIARSLSSLFNVRSHRPHVDRFEEELVVTISRDPIDGMQALCKRLLDFVLSSLLLLVLSPVMLVAAAAIKLGSPGPVFFVQERVGLNKRKFAFYKFRTMVADAEARQKDLEHLNEVSGPVFKIQNDPRITRIGRFLRKSSIDELPQLFNVLRGDMSLVGPRPLPVRDYAGFSADWQRRRFSVRPGITCLWQVNGRNAIPFDSWMQLDMQYIDEWSLLLDMKILIKTVPAVIRGAGAA